MLNASTVSRLAAIDELRFIQSKVLPLKSQPEIIFSDFQKKVEAVESPLIKAFRSIDTMSKLSKAAMAGRFYA